jgi:chromosome segregation protein
MKIKKVELVGFKSFVDRTVLHFDHDVLGIVGPNGCGKSNIVDAIRWCMGEQSARHLRGRSMDDVIFSGSESRSPHDYAEVTLTFENDLPEEMPLEYKEYGEIAVTRRIHRSGDGEYLINKTAVRLRDVTDLFLGTGAGTKAYAIVEQGKVGLIVSARPEERRLLIEEAAGITKFKARKKQAERKMELTQQNLLRVGDIVAEIERTIGSLKRQAAKAERYVAYRKEVEDLQLHESVNRYLELIGWIKLETAEVARASEVFERERGDLALGEADHEAARHPLHDAEARLEEATNTSFAAANAVRAEEAAIARSRDRLVLLTQREQQAEGERSEMSAQADRLATERQTVTAELRSLEDAEAEQALRVAEREQALDDYVTAHRIADARATERRQRIASARTEIARAEASLAGFERRRSEMAARRDRLCEERQILEASRVDLQARVGDLMGSVSDSRSQRQTAEAAKASLDRRLGELKGAVVGQERAFEERKADLSRKRSRLGALEEVHARLEGVGIGARSLVTTRDACVAGLVADRVEAPEHLTLALAGLLGARLQAVVVRDVDRGVALLEDLGQKRSGRATIVPLHAPCHAPCVAGSGAEWPEEDGIVGRLVDGIRYAVEDEAWVRALVGDAVVVRDLPIAMRLRAAGLLATLVTTHGSVLHGDGLIEGGQGDELAAGMLEGKREARALSEEIDELDRVVSRHLEGLMASRSEMAQTVAALDGVRHEAHAREIALVGAEKDLQKAEAELESVMRRMGALLREDAELDRALEEAGFERDEAARVVADGSAQVEISQQELADADAALSEARQRLDAQRQVVMAIKVAVAGTRERLAAARGTESRLSRSAAELDERGARISDELVANARTFGQTAAQLVTHKEQLQAALDCACHATDQLNQTRSAFERLRAAFVDQEGTLKEIRARVESARDELQTHEIARRENQIAMDHLLASTADKFRGVHLPHVVGDYHLRPPPDEVSRARIDELLRLLERMGSVNLDAMREHADAEQRFAFYTTQRADLDKALADLQRAIGQMNRESRRLFEETFEAVNERFREIFPRMFRGGRGELRMTDPNDLLETGIDIVAQPPGKKLSNIELMSGGEKALTAVSLVFAIFQIKPSPFCILDEVDAPLDEANVARYNELVRSMTDRSQFILITHIKRTMQMVDVLYGVTMPEAGISKIVSVKINDLQSQRGTRASEDLREPREGRIDAVA